MILIRPSRIDDINAIHSLADSAGVGITTLPKDRTRLVQRLQWSEESFAKLATADDNAYYFFVAVDYNTNTLVGCSAIETGIGHSSPFYSYKLTSHRQFSTHLALKNEFQLLNLSNDYQGMSEICTLYLAPEYRINGNGLLLSRARFLFMAEFVERFADKVIAEIRGVSDEWGNSAFWDALGQHFFQMSFSEADRLTMLTDKQFIADFMPKIPIYVKLLPEAAQAVIGQPHHLSAAALAILYREGFSYNQYVDIFDAGPTVEASTRQIQTIATSRTVRCCIESSQQSNSRFLIANNRLDFRSLIDHIRIIDSESIAISKTAAQLLEVEGGDYLRITPLDGEAI